MDLTLLLGGQEPYNRRLHDGYQRHIGVRRDDDRADVFRSEVIGDEDGGGAVRRADDGNGGGVLQLEAEERCHAQGKEDTKLGRGTEDHKLWIGKQGTEVDHSTDPDEKKKWEKLVGYACAEQDGNGPFLNHSVRCLGDGPGQGEVDQDGAEADGEQKRRFHFLLNGQVYENTSDEPHDDLLDIQVQRI